MHGSAEVRLKPADWSAAFRPPLSIRPLIGGGVDFRPRPKHPRAMSKIVLIILSLLLPPLAVYLATKSGKQTILNVVLCIFFWIPGILHALYVSLK